MDFNANIKSILSGGNVPALWAETAQYALRHATSVQSDGTVNLDPLIRLRVAYGSASASPRGAKVGKFDAFVTMVTDGQIKFEGKGYKLTCKGSNVAPMPEGTDFHWWKAEAEEKEEKSPAQKFMAAIAAADKSLIDEERMVALVREHFDAKARMLALVA